MSHAAHWRRYRELTDLFIVAGPTRDENRVEGFEDAFKDLGHFVFNVGLKLSIACEPFGTSTHLIALDHC